MKYLTFFLICFLFLACSENTVKEKTLTIGDSVKFISESEATPVTKSDKLLKALTKVLVSKDEDRIREMILNKEIFNISKGTTGKITDFSDNGFEVKVISGKFEGQYVWVNKIFLKYN